MNARSLSGMVRGERTGHDGRLDTFDALLERSGILASRIGPVAPEGSPA